MVSNLVKKGISAFASRQTNIFTAASFIMLTTGFSQLLGIFKNRILLSLFGASNELGVFFAAFRIPELVFQVVIAGALSASFIPIFISFISKDKKREGFEFVSSLINIGIVFYLIVSAIIMVFSFQLVSLVTPGFSHSELVLMSELMVIIQLSQVFIILATLCVAYLQSFQHFVVPGLASAFYNVGIILGLVFFSHFLGFGIYGGAIGVLIGAFLFFVIQIPMVFSTGYRFSLSIKITPALKQLIKLMVPRSLTILVYQITPTANVYFASFIAARALVVLDLAQTLAAAPVLLIGQSIAQASFPSLSLKSQDKQGFISIFASSFNQILYLTMPIAAILIVLRIPVVRLVYGTARFDWAATVETGLTLAYFSIALSANALIPLMYRSFYAYRDSKTPLIITIVGVILNVILSYAFILILGLPIYYLAISFSITSGVGVFLMIFMLDRKINLPKWSMIVSFLKILFSAIIMGVFLYLPIKLLDQLVFDTTRTINLIILTGIAGGIGFIAYIFLTWLLDIKEAYYVLAVIRRFSDKDKILKQIRELIDSPKLNA